MKLLGDHSLFLVN